MGNISIVGLGKTFTVDSIAIALYFIVATVITLSFIAILLSISEILKINDGKHRFINIICFLVSLVTLFTFVTFHYLLNRV